MAYHDAKLENITAAWLLPVVSTIVAAATGSIVAGILPHPQLQLITIITSYVLWGKGMSLAMVVLVCYFLRLTTQKLPPKEVIVSVFLPLGPLGQGGFAIQNLGSVARQVFRETNTLPLSMVYAGDVLYIVGSMTAMVMWGFGLVWFFFALATIWRTPKFPFNMGWWGFTFPLGTCSLHDSISSYKNDGEPVLIASITYRRLHGLHNTARERASVCILPCAWDSLQRSRDAAMDHRQLWHAQEGLYRRDIRCPLFEGSCREGYEVAYHAKKWC